MMDLMASISLRAWMRNLESLSLPSIQYQARRTYFQQQVYEGLKHFRTVNMDQGESNWLSLMSDYYNYLLILTAFFQMSNYQQDDYGVDYAEDDKEDDHEDYDELSARDHISRVPAHDSFDVSSFTQSKMGIEGLPRHIKGEFPISNAPTLEVSPDAELPFISKNNRKNDNYKLPTDMSASKGSNMDGQLQFLRKVVKKQEDQQAGFVHKIQQLNNTNSRLEKVIRDKDAVIRQKEELLLVQDRKLKQQSQQLRSSSKNISFANNQQSAKVESSRYIDEFCPEMLSPEQSLQLFAELISKIEKSTSMRKKLLSDRKIVGIMGQLFRTQ